MSNNTRRPGRGRYVFGLSVAISICAIGVATCSRKTDSALIEKFKASELHELGMSCGGSFFAVRNGNFILGNRSRQEIVQPGVQITDVGQHRLRMSANYGRLNVVTTFELKFDDTVAVIEHVQFDPELTAEQWALVPEEQAIEMKSFPKELEKAPPMVLCPVSIS